jgi:phenylacetate-CoA ligase
VANQIDTLYLNSPIWMQQIMVAVFGRNWQRRRYSSQFEMLLIEFKARDNWLENQFKSYQEEKLGQIIRKAGRSPYYRGIFASYGISPDKYSPDNLSRLPLLSKETLRVKGNTLLTEKKIPKGTIIFKSSGTTGTPTEIYYSPEFHALELAAPAARNLGWAGVNYQERRVMFGVRKVCNFRQDKPPFWRFSPSENMAYASIYHLSPRFLPDYTKFLRSYKPAMIMGYPSALYTIARYALDRDDYPAPAKAVFTTSETVTVRQREAIEKAWQCKIFDRYGAVEGCMFASQCEYGRYHVSPEVGIIEILDHDGNPCPLGVQGEVICTGLQNTLQPLIRYRIGDVASWAIEQSCPCGRQMPILETIEGRFEDICITPDGREMLRFDTVFKGVDNIKEAQVIQEQLDRFTILVIPSSGFGDQEIEKIKSNMKLHVGEVATIVKLVPNIPRSSSGKFRAVICNLPPEKKPIERFIDTKNE